MRRSCVNETGLRNSAHGAEKFGLKDLAAVHWNLPAEQLYEYAVGAHEGAAEPAPCAPAPQSATSR